MTTDPDIRKGLRGSCHCNIETSPCGAEDECRMAFAAADEIDRLCAAVGELVSGLRDCRNAMHADNPADGWKEIIETADALIEQYGERENG